MNYHIKRKILLNGKKTMKHNKISKSDMPHKDIVITDEIKISALEAEVKYWKLRHELVQKYSEG
jgi:hypothetical protein